MSKPEVPCVVSTIPAQPHPSLQLSSLTSLRSAFISTFSKRFSQFSHLPVELRLQIWELAFPAERIHEIHPCRKLHQGRLTLRSNASAPPVVLHVCRESRNLALQHFVLMDYDPCFPAKPVRKFYFNPRADTLFLNTVSALYVAFTLLEEEHEATPGRVLHGWQNVAFDADRAHLVTLLSGRLGQAPRPHFQRLFPDLKSLTIAFDFNRRGKTRFRTSVWPGENGTNLIHTEAVGGETSTVTSLFQPIREALIEEYGVDAEGKQLVDFKMATADRKFYMRGNLRYGFRKSCASLGLTPRGIFTLL